MDNDGIKFIHGLHQQMDSHAQWGSPTPTWDGAEETVRGTLTYWDETTTGDEPEETLQQVARALAYSLHGDVGWRDLLTAIEAQRDYAQARNGSHPNLHENRSGTVSNRAQLEDDTESNLNVAVWTILSAAGIQR